MIENDQMTIRCHLLITSLNITDWLLGFLIFGTHAPGISYFFITGTPYVWTVLYKLTNEHPYNMYAIKDVFLSEDPSTHNKPAYR